MSSPLAVIRRRQDFVPEDVRGGVGGSIASGSAWSGISVAALTFLQFVRSMIFARLLEPSDFGVVALANVITQFVLIFANLGFNSSIIYHRGLKRRDLTTCWWGNLAVDGTAALVCVGVALGTARFAEDPREPVVICLLAIQFMVSSVGNVNAALMRRLFRFKQIAQVNISGGVFTFAGGYVAVKVLGWGVYGLVGGMLLGNLVMTLQYLVRMPWLPSFSFSWAVLRKHISYGAWFLGVGVVTYLNGQQDKLIIRRLLDSTQLGFYEYAANIPLMVVMKLSQVLNSVLFPAFSSLQDKLDELGRLLEKVFLFNSLLIYPLLIGLGSVAPDFILVAYGTKWMPIVEPLRLFCLFGLMRLFINPLYALCNGLGKPSLPFKWSLSLLPINLGLTWLGIIQFGLKGAILAKLFVPVFMWFTLGTQIMRVIGLPRSRLYRQTLPALTCGLLMAGSVLGVKQLLDGRLPAELPRLLICVVSGALTYVGALALLWRRHFRELVTRARGLYQSESR